MGFKVVENDPFELLGFTSKGQADDLTLVGFTPMQARESFSPKGKKSLRTFIETGLGIYQV